MVLPRATNTMWNPVRPATGTKNRPATHITAILGGQGQEVYNKCDETSRRSQNNNTVKWSLQAKKRIRNSRMWCVQMLRVAQDIEQAETKYIDDVSSKW